MSLKCAPLLVACLLVGGFAIAQETAAVSPAPAHAASQDRAGIDDLLKSYESAFKDKNLEALLAIYPSLQQNQKEYKNARWHLVEDPNVFSEQMTLGPLDVQINGNQATVRARRTEQYFALETSSQISSGDINMSNMPAQNPSPAPATKKKPTRKADVVVMELVRRDNTWQIASLAVDKKAR